MSDYCVIGSGISGATIANLLNKKFQVNLYDKGRGPGGRASFKRIKGQIGFDHGTQYFLSLIHISEPTRLLSISYAVFCL